MYSDKRLWRVLDETYRRGRDMYRTHPEEDPPIGWKMSTFSSISKVCEHYCV